MTYVMLQEQETGPKSSRTPLMFKPSPRVAFSPHKASGDSSKTPSLPLKPVPRGSASSKKDTPVNGFSLQLMVFSISKD